MKYTLIILTWILNPFLLQSQGLARNYYGEDFDFFWKTISENYAYWDKKQTDWNRVKTTYRPLMDTVSSKHSFISIIEKIFDEIYDHHASLSANNANSYQLVPTGSDIWAEFTNGIPVITEVRPGSGAAVCGLKAGMRIVSVNDKPIETLVAALLPKHLTRQDIEADNYALRLVLAGRHQEMRKIEASYRGAPQYYYPDRIKRVPEDQGPMLSANILQAGIGYIKIHNRLWDNNLVFAFDSVLDKLSETKSLILDLRETPSGGNTTVARSIIGRFISKAGFYQKHEIPAEQKEFGVIRSWVEIVSPKPRTYSKPLILLVNHWTGSVGEGITIGFDALHRATIIGTHMAGLNGAVYSFTMPNTQIGFNFPAEKLFHVNGKPRENFKPGIEVDMTLQKNEADLILSTALQFLQKSGLVK